MLHELKRIVAEARLCQQRGEKCVLATVVDLDGSSYRKPGVRMLIAESGKMTGAISGGCVEQEICRRAQTVFADDEAKVVTYDGRYRLGCEGVLFVLLEPFYVSDELLKAFSTAIKFREDIKLTSYFERTDEIRGSFGTKIEFENGNAFGESMTDCRAFLQTLAPCFRLLIVGSEHDALQLCLFASLLGWEVEILVTSSESKELRDFPGAQKVCASPLSDFSIDSQTAVVLMTHNYSSDLKFLMSLQQRGAAYIGVLGSEKRHERLQSDMINFGTPNAKEFSNAIFSPTGLDIGAISPGEIAVSILAEITSVVRDKSVFLRQSS